MRNQEGEEIAIGARIAEIGKAGTIIMHCVEIKSGATGKWITHSEHFTVTEAEEAARDLQKGMG